MSSPLRFRQLGLLNPLRFEILDTHGRAVGVVAVPWLARGCIDLHLGGQPYRIDYARQPGRFPATVRYTLSDPKGHRLAEVDVEPTLRQLGPRVLLRAPVVLSVGTRGVMGPLDCKLRDEAGAVVGAVRAVPRRGVKRELEVDLSVSLDTLEDRSTAIKALLLIVSRIVRG